MVECDLDQVSESDREENFAIARKVMHDVRAAETKNR